MKQRSRDPATSHQWLPLLVTNITKLAGLGLALNEVFIQAHPRTLEILLSAFMMAGAQISEDTVMSLWGRIFAVEPSHHETEHHK